VWGRLPEGNGLTAQIDRPRAIIASPASTLQGALIARPATPAKNRQNASFSVTETFDDPDNDVTESRNHPDNTGPGNSPLDTPGGLLPRNDYEKPFSPRSWQEAGRRH
jgi:hypothetical protein